MSGPVLVLTGADDPTADAVTAELCRRGTAVHRVDLADFPAGRGFTARFDTGRWHATLAGVAPDVPDVQLTDVSAVCYRPYSPITVPGTVAEKLVAYLDAFGLRFGVFDLVITPDDEWVMLECNPNGQWLWFHHRTGLPIPGALADVLTGGRPG